MNNYNELLNKEKKLAVIGLGYVGMPIAIQFAKKVDVVGFDVNSAKIKEYKRGHDVTGEAGDDELKATSMTFSSQESDLVNIGVFIVAVPTPVNLDKTPDLSPVIGAWMLYANVLNLYGVGKLLKKVENTQKQD
jgi:UDP-N-acetyl-D-galactosamine dehydrogenase